MLNWTHVLGLPLVAYPNLRRYLARVAARPTVAEALAAEGLASPAPVAA